MRTTVAICSKCDNKICVATAVDMPACLSQVAGEDYNELPEEWQCFNCLMQGDGYWPVSKEKFIAPILLYLTLNSL